MREPERSNELQSTVAIVLLCGLLESLIWDPCSLGLPEMLTVTVAQIFDRRTLSLNVQAPKCDLSMQNQKYNS